MKEKSKNKSILKIVLIILCSFIALIAIAAIIIFSMRYQFMRSVLGEINYYAYAEAKTVSDLVEDETFKPLLESKNIQLDSKAVCKTSEKDSASANFKYSFDKNKNKWTSNVSVNFFGNETGEILINSGNGKIGIDAPDIMAEGVTIKNTSNDSIKSDAAKCIADLIPVIKRMEKGTLKDNISVSEGKVDGVKCRKVAVTLTEREYYLVYAELLETLKKDDSGFVKDLKAFLKNNAALSKIITEMQGESEMEDTNEVIDGFIENIPATVESLKYEADVADDKETFFSYTVYYKNDNEIIKRELVNDDVNVTVDTVSRGKEKSVNVNYDEGGKSKAEYKFSKKKSAKATAASFVYTEDAQEYINISSENLNVKKLKGVEVPVGDIKIFLDGGATVCNIKMAADKTYKIDAKMSDNEDVQINLSVDTKIKGSPDLSGYKEPDKNNNDDFGGIFDAILDKMYGSDDLTFDEGEYIGEDGEYYLDEGDFEFEDEEGSAEAVPEENA